MKRRRRLLPGLFAACIAVFGYCPATLAAPANLPTPPPPKPLMVLVNRDDPQSMRQLGQFYWRYAQSDPEALRKSVFWFDRAARLDDHAAQAMVSELYERGQGVPRSAERAAWFAMHAARSGDARSQYRYARFLELGSGLPRNLVESRLWYRRAADQGQAQAARWMGEQLARETTRPAAMRESVRYLAIAARNGDTTAASTLARLSARLNRLANARPNVNIRKSPSLDAAVVAKTTPVTVMYLLGERSQGWVEVYRPDGHVTGYANTQALTGG